MRSFASLLAVLFISCVWLSAQGLPLKKLWGSVEFSIAPAVVDMNYDYDERDRNTFTTTTIGLSAFGGVRVSPNISIGAGTGLSYFDGADVLYVPVQGELKYLAALKRKDGLGYFLYGRGGYPFMPGQSKSDGMLAGIGFGLTFGGSYSVSAGYSFTHLDYTTRSNRPYNPTRHAVEVKFGLNW